jgi:glucose-6-phosphate dehydrogenase-like protein OpcA
VQAERGNPSAALIAGWLTARLGVKVRRTESAGPGVTAVQVRFTGNDRLRIDRPDGYLATLSRTGITDRQLPLKRRDLGELLAEELRRLDADQPYADALSAVTGEKDLDSRPPMRTLVWHDPERPGRRRKSSAGGTTSKSGGGAASKSVGKSTAKQSNGSASGTSVRKATERKAAASKKAAASTKARTAAKVAARRARKATTTATATSAKAKRSTAKRSTGGGKKS